MSGLKSMDPLLERHRHEAEGMRKARLKKMSPKGTLGLPPLLDERRLEYGITDKAFERQPTYDRVYIYQIEDMAVGEFMDEESSIVVPENLLDKERKTAPRGILLACGLAGLNALISNGIQLGDIVEFSKRIPLKLRYDRIGGKEEELLMLRAGEINSSLDLVRRLRSGEASVVYDRTENEFQYKDPDGNMWTPKVPFMGVEY